MSHENLITLFDLIKNADLLESIKKNSNFK